MRRMSDEEIANRVGRIVSVHYLTEGQPAGYTTTFAGPTLRILVRNVDRTFFSKGPASVRPVLAAYPCFMLGAHEECDLVSINLSTPPISEHGDAIVKAFDLSEHFVIFDPEDKTYFIPNDPKAPLDGGCDWTTDPTKAFKYSTYSEARTLAGGIDPDRLMKLEVLSRRGGVDG